MEHDTLWGSTNPINLPIDNCTESIWNMILCGVQPIQLIYLLTI